MDTKFQKTRKINVYKVYSVGFDSRTLLFSCFSPKMRYPLNLLALRGVCFFPKLAIFFHFWHDFSTFLDTTGHEMDTPKHGKGGRLDLSPLIFLDTFLWTRVQTVTFFRLLKLTRSDSMAHHP